MQEAEPRTDKATTVFRRLASGAKQAAGVSGEQPVPQAMGGVGAVYFSPWQNLEQVDYNAIAHSRCDHLDIAAYSFTDWELAQAVVLFAQSGRQVRIYRDYEQYQEEGKRGSRVADMLRVPNISIRVKHSSVLMHQKAWSDGCILREGSANWSPSGEKSQDNTLTFLTDPPSVINFEHAFEAMWSRRDNIVVQ
jgi:phosphatidylserine/phosphatidylglycerophosphate/cardiolipin synthase-like enzyme